MVFDFNLTLKTGKCFMFVSCKPNNKFLSGHFPIAHGSSFQLFSDHQNSTEPTVNAFFITGQCK